MVESRIKNRKNIADLAIMICMGLSIYYGLTFYYTLTGRSGIFGNLYNVYGIGRTDFAIFSLFVLLISFGMITLYRKYLITGNSKKFVLANRLFAWLILLLIAINIYLQSR